MAKAPSEASSTPTLGSQAPLGIDAASFARQRHTAVEATGAPAERPWLQGNAIRSAPLSEGVPVSPTEPVASRRVVSEIPDLVGLVLGSRYRVDGEMHRGQGRRVYRAKDLQDQHRWVALKLEAAHSRGRRESLLRTEWNVLQKLRGSPHIPKTLDYVDNEPIASAAMLVQRLYGENLSSVLKGKRVQPATVAFIGQQMLGALKTLHQKGLLHRDVKPGNFVFGRRPEERYQVFLIDFEMARRHLDETGTARRARSKAAFRGTTHYASAASIRGEDLGRADDLWSLLWIFIELLAGSLPWQGLYRHTMNGDEKLKAKRRVLAEKERLIEAGMHGTPEGNSDLKAKARLLKSLPPAITEWLRELSTLRYESKPDYIRLEGLLQHMGRKSSRAVVMQELEAVFKGRRRHRPADRKLAKAAKPPKKARKADLQAKKASKTNANCADGLLDSSPVNSHCSGALDSVSL